MARQESWQEREARERREAEEAMHVACEVLRRLHVQTVTATYDGSGDDGAIESIRYHPEPPTGLPDGLHGIVEKFVYTSLPGGWEINAGSNGTLTFDVKSAKSRLDHHWNEDDEDEEWEEAGDAEQDD